jgi:hypothetical protein
MKPTLSPALLFAALAGCADPVSNDIFLADLDFVAALPASDRLTMDLRSSDDEAPAAASETLDLRSLSQLLADDLGAIYTDALDTVDLVRQGPPAERGTNSRSWGPFDVGVDGRIVNLDMARIGDRTFTWSFAWSELDGSGERAFFGGEHFAGATVGEGDGSFRYDFADAAELVGDTAAGELEIEYDLRVGRELRVYLLGYQSDPDEAPLDLDVWFFEDGDARDFEFFTDEDDALEGLSSLMLRTRVLAEVGGRSDATVEALDGNQDEVSQCWDASGEVVWQADTLGLFETVGSESDCAYSAAAAVAHL